MSSSITIPNTQKFTDILGRVGDMTLNNIINATGKGTDAGLLVKSLAGTILGLSDSSIKRNNVIETNDSKNVNIFLNNVARAVAAFCAFLDYDADGEVQLVKRDASGKVIIGDDIAAMEKDFDAISSSFKNQGDVGATILAILSSIAIYFSGTHFTTEKEDFVSFKSACEDVYTSYVPIKSMDHAQFFKENVADIMTFIIALCIISIPTIELVNQKIAAINTAKVEGTMIDPIDITVTNSMVSQAVKTMYGLNMEFILAAITNVVDVFVKTMIVTGTGSKLANFLKRKCCCSA